ncbi:hypothetical protein DFP72DRAFT_415314 [Ephemerocybe angulata]|uniref:DUF6533 domain-containing protein n=1 Tax=Ephemerocybe angulata TaxID=980116 RepID=A0A8H6IEQ0_9AGAR|nr:hypothetical protein DFP72DRAFT_415314 [Tulosesus angulatus]
MPREGIRFLPNLPLFTLSSRFRFLPNLPLFTREVLTTTSPFELLRAQHPNKGLPVLLPPSRIRTRQGSLLGDFPAVRSTWPQETISSELPDRQWEAQQHLKLLQPSGSTPVPTVRLFLALFGTWCAAMAESSLAAFKAQTIWNYAIISSCTIVVVDYIQTLPDEVRHMWTAPLSIPKLLFIAVRYSIFFKNFSTMVVPGTFFADNFSVKGCLHWFRLTAATSMFIMVTSEAILFYRVYAFSGRGRRMFVALAVQFIVIHAGVAYFLGAHISSVKFTISQLPAGTTCVLISSSGRLNSAIYATLLGSVTIAMLFMVVLLFRKHWGFDSKLLTAFYSDGISYFLCLAVLISANVAVNWVARDAYKNILILYEMDAHAILSTRMLLHIRKVADKSLDDISFSRIMALLPTSTDIDPGPQLPHPVSDNLSTLRFRAFDSLPEPSPLNSLEQSA